MKDTTISQAVRYVGADDKTIDLLRASMWFPTAFPTIPM